MSDVTLTNEEYTALVYMARQGATDGEVKRRLDAFLRDIERKNGITRYFLKVRWQELNTPLPAGTDFPESWPPNLEADIENTERAVAQADVEALLKERASQPENVMVSRDPAGIVGWSKLEDFFR